MALLFSLPPTLASWGCPFLVVLAVPSPRPLRVLLRPVWKSPSLHQEPKGSLRSDTIRAPAGHRSRPPACAPGSWRRGSHVVSGHFRVPAPGRAFPGARAPPRCGGKVGPTLCSRRRSRRAVSLFAPRNSFGERRGENPCERLLGTFPRPWAGNRVGGGARRGG